MEKHSVDSVSPRLFNKTVSVLPWLKLVFSGRNTYSSLKSIYKQEVHKFHNLHRCVHWIGYEDLA